MPGYTRKEHRETQPARDPQLTTPDCTRTAHLEDMRDRATSAGMGHCRLTNRPLDDALHEYLISRGGRN